MAKDKDNILLNAIHEHDDHIESHKHEHIRFNDKGELERYVHEHLDENENVPHHHHSKEEKKRQTNRIAKAIGHLQHIQTMIDNDVDCSEVLIQLSAVRAAINNLGKSIINEHLEHCITHAMAYGDMQTLEEFEKSIDTFFK
jgi:DNA-binding FrmR family transcriptional regulator